MYVWCLSLSLCNTQARSPGSKGGGKGGKGVSG